MKKIFYAFVLAMALAFCANGAIAAEKTGAPGLQQIRNATMKFRSGDTVFLIDPIFAEVGAYDGFPNTYRSWLRNPLIPLPMPVKDILADVDAVILTHLHLDHWDEAAQRQIPKDMTIFTQNEEDANIVRGQGFKDVRILKNEDEFAGIRMSRTATQHGTKAMYADAEMAKALGDVMGIVFLTPDGKKTWLVGDSIWFDGIDEALKKHKPDVIIVNSGGAALALPQFENDPEIIMDKKDVLRMVKSAPQATVVATHMDAINHMTVDRKDLAQFTREQGIRDKVLIPFDGEIMNF